MKGILKELAMSGEPGSNLQRVDVLIDVGALITGMSNQDVAQYLLDNGLGWAKGVVFLDNHDEKSVLLRRGGDGQSSDGKNGGRVMKLHQCGIAWSERFSFYDQIHTTGMDIKQHNNAKACITVGKDTTLRDFAQGAYRMRGISKGQTIQLLIIPEVLKSFTEELQCIRSQNSTDELLPLL